MVSSETLFRSYIDGDESVVTEILNRYHHGLILFINRYVRDVATAEELAADSFAQLFVSPKKYNFKVSLKTYLFMIGKSRALDWLRSNHRRKTEQLPENLEGGEDPEQLLIAQQEKRELYDAIASLRGDYKTAIHLIYFEQLSYKEAAFVMKKNVRQVQNLVYRAKGALKEILEKEGSIQ